MIQFTLLSEYSKIFSNFSRVLAPQRKEGTLPEIQGLYPKTFAKRYYILNKH